MKGGVQEPVHELRSRPRGIGGSIKQSASSRPVLIAAWAALLFLPFKGIMPALTLFIIIVAGLPALQLARKPWSAGFRTAALKSLPRFPLRVFAESRFGRSSALPLLFIILLVLPFTLRDYYMDVLVMSGIYVLLALGLNVIVGFTGLLNLGFAAFYAIGAYTYALLNTKLGLGFWPSLPLSAGAAALSGLLLAFPASISTGRELAIVTLGFGEILRIVLNNWDSFTNGPNGISGITPPFLFGVSLGSLKYYYYLVLLIVLVAVPVMKRVEASRIGRAWLAIKENEIAASSMGINTTRYKLYAFAFGTFWAGIAGILFAAKMRFVSPESFTFMESVLILSMVILGGLGNIYGAAAGAVILVVLPEALREVQSYRMLILGIGLVLLMIFRPQGLLSRNKILKSRKQN
ncbi:MAG: branched-chain amino acid ABC transporter permease [Nitrospirae bacterium]|nr:branched-chain amino acid ABC transporter permease [Nitrospirota bacterium]